MLLLRHNICRRNIETERSGDVVDVATFKYVPKLLQQQQQQQQQQLQHHYW